jgi:hypothetical protein
MAKTIEAQGSYKNPDSKEDVYYSFDYLVIDSVKDSIDELGEDKVKSLVQRMLKMDANNVAREKAKTLNGHSTRQPLSEEEKSKRKAQRQVDKELLAMLKSKGLTAKDLADL